MIKINYLDNGITKVEEVVKAGTKIQRVIGSTADLRNHNLFDCGDFCRVNNYTPVNGLPPKVTKLPTIIKPLPEDFSIMETMFGHIDYFGILSEALIIVIIIVLFAIVVGSFYRWLRLKLIQKGVMKREN